jgi:hypothetical protein
MEMRTTLSAAITFALGTLAASAATAQTASSGTGDQTTITGQSIAGQTSGGPNSSIATQTMPAPVTTTPPINPNAGTLAPLTNTPPQRMARLRKHGLMGTSNSFQNGINGAVQSNGVVNGTATMTPPPLAAPTTSKSTNNGPANAPGTVAAPTPAAPSGQ